MGYNNQLHYLGGDLPSFIATFNTANTSAGSSSATEVSLPYSSFSTYSGTIDWGDGTITANNFANRTHNYASSGVYTVTVKGEIGFFRYNNTEDKLKILSVLNWGGLQFNTFGIFRGCSNLQLNSVVGAPLNIVTLNGMFNGCSSLTTIQGVNSWDVSAVSDFNDIFVSCSSFNQDLNGWDTSNATNMLGTFYLATSFNGDISGWDFSGVTDTRFMFYFASSFNQNIGGWNTSSIALIGYMFQNCTSFNQDISGWDFSNVTDMTSFMLGKSDANYTPVFYDNLLAKWVADGVSGVTIGMGGVKYTIAGASDRATINGVNTLTDGGQI
tara:strand:- start:4688 stop:5668 length:981 start_codon:yes stop_codon:yes gene_type:complete